MSDQVTHTAESVGYYYHIEHMARAYDRLKPKFAYHIVLESLTESLHRGFITSADFRRLTVINLNKVFGLKEVEE